MSPRHDCILEELVAPVQVILRSAGQLILAAEEAGFGIEKKSDKNYVTEVDLAVQNQIVEQLAQLTPGYAIMAEERIWMIRSVTGQSGFLIQSMARPT